MDQNKKVRDQDKAKESIPQIQYRYKAITTTPVQSSQVIIVTLCVGYGYLYGIRKIFPCAISLITNEIPLYKSEIGMISSNFTLSYGVSKFISSVLCDYISNELLFCLGVIFSSVSLIMFSKSYTLYRFSCVWLLHGMFQGLGWPSIESLICTKIPSSNRGYVWSLVSACGMLGNVVMPVVFSQVHDMDWRVVFTWAGGMGIFLGVSSYVTLLWTGRNTLTSPVPVQADQGHDIHYIDNVTKKSKSKGAKEGKETSMNEERGTFPRKAAQNQNTVSQSMTTSTWSNYVDLMLSPSYWAVNLATALSYMASKGISDWTALYLLEVFNLSISQSNNILGAFEVGSVIGCFASGVAVDSLMGGNATKTALLFSSISVPALAVMLYIDVFYVSQDIFDLSPTPLTQGAMSLLLSKTSLHIVMFTTCLLIAGIGIAGSRTVIGMVVRHLSPQGIEGFASGVNGIVGQAGASLSGIGLGYALDSSYRWSLFHPIMAGSCIAATLLLLFASLQQSPNSLALASSIKKEQ